MVAYKEVPGGGIEPPTRGFSVLNNELAISHHFQTLTYQALPGTMLEYVGFSWVIFGCGGYNSVTVFVTIWPEPCNHLGGGEKMTLLNLMSVSP